MEGGESTASAPKEGEEKPGSSSEKTSSVESPEVEGTITYTTYESERQMPDIMKLFQKDLSEPYSIYTYRYFINNWPKLCVLAYDSATENMVGAIVCKLDRHRGAYRGYIAMLAVELSYRNRGIGSTLVKKAIDTMQAEKCDEVVLETEVTNKGSLALYDKLGFMKDKRLCRYYLNGVDAFRLKIYLRHD